MTSTVESPVAVVRKRKLQAPTRSTEFSVLRPCPANPTASKLRVALINPPDPSSADNSRASQPLGLGYIAAYAREQGFHVDVFDLSLEPASAHALRSSGVLAGGYDVFGISTYSDNFQDTIALVEDLKRLMPSCIIVLGGYHVTLLPDATIEAYRSVDFVVCGEGEHPFSMLLSVLGQQSASDAGFEAIPDLCWRDGSGRVRVNQVCKSYADQHSLPVPVTDLAYCSAPFARYSDPITGRQKRTLNLVGSRGCPKRCTFCSIVLINPLWRSRSVDSIMQELKLRSANERFDHVVFQDANALVSPKRALEFAQRLVVEFPGVTWSGTATPDQVVKHKDVIAAIGSLNCSSLEVGIESGNDRTLARFGKGTTVQINEAALRVLEDSGIAAGIDFIMFDEDMRIDDLQQNFQFLLENDLTGVWPPALLHQEVRLYPGTRLRELHESIQGPAPPHTIPDLIFHDRKVGAVFSSMQWFAKFHQPSINALVGHVRALLDWFVTSKIRHPAQAGVLAQQVALAEIRLRHAPYSYFKRVLDRIARDESGETPVELEAEGDAAMIGVAALINNSASVAADFQECLRQMGLDAKFVHRRSVNAA